jgi:sugar fermentation stimulation protein A
MNKTTRPEGKITNSDSGLYIAVFHLSRSKEIQVGWLGKFRFKPGIYFYVGSAKRNLSARIERHDRKKKLMHWHIDYLSVKAKMLGAIIIPNQRKKECGIAEELGRMYKLAVPGFGASDCKCAGHLIYTASL